MSIPEKLFIKKKNPSSEDGSIDTLLEGEISSSENEHVLEAMEKKLSIDLIETDNTYIVLAQVPGIPIKNLSITLDHDTLTVSGETHKATFATGETVYKECSWGQFSRSITLPKNIKRTGHKANIKDGILTVILPKTKKKNPKQIPIASYDD